MKRIKALFVLLLCWLSVLTIANAEITEATKLSELFPDTVLAQQIAARLRVDKNSLVTQDQLNNITTFGINNHSDWKGVKDWSGLRHLKNLTELYAYGEDGCTYSIEELSTLTKLKTLHIAFATVSGDFDSIVALQNLENFDLTAVVFSDAATYALPKSLKKLYLHEVDNATGSLDVLSGMKKLEDVWLVNIEMGGSISVFSTLTQIKSIDLCEMEATGELSAFSSLNNLESLSVLDTGCGGNISALANLKDLRHLSLRTNNPNEPEKEIDFSGNLASLASLTNLEELNLYYTNIEGSISDLMSLSKLRNLGLAIDFTGDINVITSLENLEGVDLRSPYATCTLNEDFLKLIKLQQFSTTYIDFEGDLSILGKLPACYGLMIYYPTIELPEIEFTTDEPIEVKIPQVAEDRKLIPQSLNSRFGTYENGKISWKVPSGTVGASGGQYSYYTSQHFEENSPYSRFTFMATIIQPYKKPRTIIEGNIGTAGYSSITGLDSGKKYAISSDVFEGGITVKYKIEANGTVGTQIVDTDKYEDMPVLTQNSIINLENYKTYTVYELSDADFIPTPTPTPDSSLEGDIVDGESALDKLSPVKVPTLVLPDGTVEELDLILKFNGPIKEGKNNIKYDVRLVDSEGNKVELPKECILCFPYPEGLDETSGKNYRIMIHHLGDKGMEKFSTEDGTIDLKPQGLCIRVSSLSPFIIEWEELPEADLPQTGDSSHIALWLALLTVAGAMMLTLKRKTA